MAGQLEALAEVFSLSLVCILRMKIFLWRFPFLQLSSLHTFSTWSFSKMSNYVHDCGVCSDAARPALTLPVEDPST